MGTKIEGVDDLLTVKEVAAALRTSEWVVKQAIHDGRLKAFIPGGRVAAAPGRGQGYRIRRADAEKWYFGDEGGKT